MENEIEVVIESNEDNVLKVSINKGTESIWFWVDKKTGIVSVEYTHSSGSGILAYLKFLENRVEEIKGW